MKFTVAFFTLLFAFFINGHASEIRFAIYRGKNPIGSYTFVISGPETARKIEAKMDIEVKILGITAYKATHQRKEIWSSSKLQSLSGSSTYNGKNYQFKLITTRQGSALETNGQTESLRPLHFTFLPWAINAPKAAEADFITEKGDIRTVQLQNMGREIETIGDKKMSLTHIIYRDKEEDWERNAWYDSTGRLQIMRYQQGQTQIQLIRETP
ncbi:MAG: DUF6134 family protein [Chthoniobacterales bacterium]